MEMGLFRGLLTAVLFVAFVGTWIWAWSRKRRDDFEAAAQMPLENDERPPAGTATNEQTNEKEREQA